MADRPSRITTTTSTASRTRPSELSRVEEAATTAPRCHHLLYARGIVVISHAPWTKACSSKWTTSVSRQNNRPNPQVRTQVLLIFFFPLLCYYATLDPLDPVSWSFGILHGAALERTLVCLIVKFIGSRQKEYIIFCFHRCAVVTTVLLGDFDDHHSTVTKYNIEIIFRLPLMNDYRVVIGTLWYKTYSLLYVYKQINDKKKLSRYSSRKKLDKHFDNVFSLLV